MKISQAMMIGTLYIFYHSKVSQEAYVTQSEKCTFWLNAILKNELCLNSHHSDHLPINQV